MLWWNFSRVYLLKRVPTIRRSKSVTPVRCNPHSLARARPSHQTAAGAQLSGVEVRRIGEVAERNRIFSQTLRSQVIDFNCDFENHRGRRQPAPSLANVAEAEMATCPSPQAHRPNCHQGADPLLTHLPGFHWPSFMLRKLL